ncbi:MAG: hypothetical protein HF978_04760 [Desulfobacteraceae bacterium]|nr:hypothetical protein [Desulfobacteraceae bacterium]MBC2754840.1 hypothetical protein [Desulfobacteraceae bacterium]
MQRCSKCVTPTSYPKTHLNHEGICNYCLDYENIYSNWENSKKDNIEKFIHLINWAKKRSKTYDALVPLSGGKDSIYVLYLARKKYNLKVLCYNFDNGFQSDIARENIKSAVDSTGADLIVVKPDEKLLMQLYKHFLKHVGMFCPVCMRGIYYGQFSIAKQHKIPLVLKGTSMRTEENLVPEIFQDGSLSFFKNVLKKFPFTSDIRPFLIDRDLKAKIFRAIYLLSKGKYIFGSIDIQVPEYFDWIYEDIYKIISNEMGWKALPDRDEHVDCLADPTVHYLRAIRCKALTPNTLRYSAEIRSCQMDRQKAINLIEEEKQAGIKTKYIDYFIDKLCISRQDLMSYMSNNLRHMKFQRDGLIMSGFNMIRKLI